MSKKEQKLIFTASKTSDGMMKINMTFYPPLAATKEAFEALPMDRREMQNALADCGRFTMMKLAERDLKKKADEQIVSLVTS